MTDMSPLRDRIIRLADWWDLIVKDEQQQQQQQQQQCSTDELSTATTTTIHKILDIRNDIDDISRYHQKLSFESLSSSPSSSSNIPRPRVEIVHIPEQELHDRSFELPARKVPFTLLISSHQVKDNTSNNSSSNSSSSTLDRVSDFLLYGTHHQKNQNQNQHRNDNQDNDNNNNNNSQSRPSRGRKLNPWRVLHVLVDGDDNGFWDDARKLGLIQNDDDNNTDNITRNDPSTTSNDNNDINDNDNGCTNDDDERQNKKQKTMINDKDNNVIEEHPQTVVSAPLALRRRRRRCPQPRLWQPDSMVQNVLCPLLKETIVKRRNQQRHSNEHKQQQHQQQHQHVAAATTASSDEEPNKLEIWDLASGSGRDVAFLAEELQYHVDGMDYDHDNERTSPRGSTTSQDHSDDRTTPSLRHPRSPFIVVGCDHRYNTKEANVVSNFWNRRQISDCTKYLKLDLSKWTTLQPQLSNNNMSNLVAMYCVRFWKPDLVDSIATCDSIPVGVLFGISHFCKPTLDSTWDFDHPNEKRVLERYQLSTLFSQHGWTVLHDEITTESDDRARPMIHFVARR